MKQPRPVKAYYVGAEFPDFYGQLIELRDDFSTTEPLYEIRFQGETQWHGNMLDKDWQWNNPSGIKN